MRVPTGAFVARRNGKVFVTGNSGFPKSLDVSKAIDRMDASEEQERRRLRFTAWVRSQGVTSKQIDDATGTNMGGHYTTAASQPAIMTREHLEACRHLFREVPRWVEQECDIRSVESVNFAAREVLGKGKSGTTAIWADGGMGNFDLTAPATESAKQWNGWGTALKPSHETLVHAVKPLIETLPDNGLRRQSIVVARKPLEGTVAANVLKWGTGGINVDATRVRTADQTNARWPANLIHDGSDEVLAEFAKYGERRSSCGGGLASDNSPCGMFGLPGVDGRDSQFFDTGTAARFFYTAKASKDDRNDGLWDWEHEEAPVSHPTVKPTSLMRYLVRLVTPKGGLVLDPFAGSGTTLIAAYREDCRAIGIELDPEYHKMASHRIDNATAQMRLAL